MSASWQILVGDARERLADLEPRSVQTVVTSPPYFGLRDYGTGEWEGGDPECDHKPGRSTSRVAAGSKQASQPAADLARWSECGRCGAVRQDKQIGLEPTPEEFCQAIVEVFRLVREVLRDDGTVWLNLGDSYNAYNGNRGTQSGYAGDREKVGEPKLPQGHGLMVPDLKQKDLIGIPWMVAFALRADGWYLRSDIIWAKPNPMPESVTDRPTKAHEYVFLLSKQPRYFYDADAIREAHTDVSIARQQRGRSDDHKYADGGPGGQKLAMDMTQALHEGGRNKRSVWEISPQAFPGAHFATFPPKLVEPCILAGSAAESCPACRKPWKRVTERVETGETQKMADGWDTSDGRHGTVHRNGRSKGEAGVPVTVPRTVGFEPDCDCCEYVKEPVPSVVLDPFAGAGTTGMVALRHGRSFVGIELNPEYAEIARRRIVDDAPLLNSFAEVPA